MLALQAAMHGSAITRLALYEPPYLSAPDPRGAAHVARLAELVRAGRRGDAVEYFQQEIVGIPEPVVVQLRHAPFRAALERLAPTLVYDATIIGDRSLPSVEQAARVTAPTLTLAGDASHPSMPAAARGLAAVLPNAEARILLGQTHDLDPAALAPLLEACLLAPIG
jgi:2-polyprenyl-6-methoxyphenol hydroxylase-like FAD-dependent oxidoreductase